MTNVLDRSGALVRQLVDLRRTDVETVGGKGANLGEMLSAGLPVPDAFVIAVDAYARFRDGNGLGERIARELARVAPDDPSALERSARTLRALLVQADMPPDLAAEIGQAYDALAGSGKAAARVAVRSSATAEDTAQFSFAGMFESFLNVHGKDGVLEAVKACWASTFNARVLFYRLTQKLPPEMPVAVVVQRMLDSDKSGVVFTTDPATHDPSRIVVEAVWGLGEAIVQGAVTPDRHVLDKQSLEVIESTVARKEFLLAWNEETQTTEQHDLTDDARATTPVLSADELRAIGTLARRAEQHYGRPQDIEFAVERGTVYLTQSRPITTLGNAEPSREAKAPDDGEVLVRGLGASPGRASGPVRRLESSHDETSMQQGDVLVTRMTSPDWVPVMRRAAAIVTDSGGMTSHAAIVARELGLPCIVGARDATSRLSDGEVVTVDGSAGTVVRGKAEPTPPAGQSTGADASGARPRASKVSLVTATRLYVNLAEPRRAATVAALDVDGVGLLRAEFMMLEALDQTHPAVFLAEKRGDEFVSRMADGLRTFAEAFTPRPVVYRTMDFRSNEFRGLRGGEEHEGAEANPMIGYRGCFRYTKEPELFGLELAALAMVRREHQNLHLMLPFVRRPLELERCLKLVDASPLGDDPRLERWIMAEVPSVVHHLPAYARLGISGVSIGSNDLTQLMLGVDRDSELLSQDYDERDGAVLAAIQSIIRESRRLGLTCSICGQAPSVHAEYAERLVEWGIDSISVNVDAIDRTRRNIAAAEQAIILRGHRGRDAGP